MSAIKVGCKKHGREDCDECFMEACGPVRQRQDSLDDQLRDVRKMAEQMGCYDAADWIRARTL